MPSISNHVCRVSNKEHDKFRSAKRKHDGKEYTIRYGRIKADKKWEEYEYFYSVDIWSIAEAKKHCKEHDGLKFEAASKSLEGAIEFLEEFKSGRVISAVNLKLINNAVKALVALLKAAEPSKDTQGGGKSIIPGSIGRLGQDEEPQQHSKYLEGIEIPKS